ncbi:MAG: glycerol-3-phosphate 1-O-acyltransferase PlsY [Actinomycetota bacterium]|nr:glycerol-3-phosphate 1-O-acyltransferase PlsY [Actinomycetota bacterium]
MDVLAPLVIAYLIGSIDFGVIVPRILGVDIYSTGSGNPGTSNVMRSLGKGPAAMVLLGDGAKGAIAAAIGAAWAGTVSTTASAEVLAFACAFAAVLGHIAPIWHRFRGGRGVATAIGAAIYLAPIFGVLLAVTWLVVTLVFKVASIASLGAMALYVPGFALSGYRGWSLVWAAGIAVLVVVRHAPNIRRLAAGSERSVAG